MVVIQRATQRRGWLSLPLVVLLLAGCTSGSSPSDIDEPAIVMVGVEDMRTFTLPLDAYRVFGGDARVLADAFTAGLLACMRDFGFTETPAAPDSDGRLVPEGNERLYGLTDLAVARERGYYTGRRATAASDSTDEVVAPVLPETWYAIAYGRITTTEDGQQVPVGGCAGEARRSLAAGTPDVDVDLADRLAMETSNRAERDSRVQAAFAAWSSCMARKGYNYATPWDANDDAAWFEAPQRPTAREIATAVADVECKIEVDLVDIWASVHIAYQNRAIEENAQALALIEQYRKIVLENAQEILEGR